MTREKLKCPKCGNSNDDYPGIRFREEYKIEIFRDPDEDETVGEYMLDCMNISEVVEKLEFLSTTLHCAKCEHEWKK